MQLVWPAVEGGTELASRIFSAYPRLRVAVGQTSPIGAAPRELDRTAQRIDRLIYRPPLWRTIVNSSGTLHESHFGDVNVSEDRRRVRLTLRAPREASSRNLTGYDISQQLAATPLTSLWQVRVSNVYTTEITLDRAHPKPAALVALAFSPTHQSASASLPWPGDYDREASSPRGTSVLSEKA